MSPPSFPLADTADPTAAYAAGLIDGEGCIYVTKKRHARVDVGMAESGLPLLKELRNLYGGNVTKTRAGTDKWQQAYAWTIQTTAAAAMLRQVMPLLRLKREQALLAIEAEELRITLTPEGKRAAKWTPDANARIQAIRARISELNRKGPRTERVQPVDVLWMAATTSLEDPSGEPFFGTWPRSGMTWHGHAYALPTSALLTSETGSLPSPPTPVAGDGREKGGGGRWSATSAPLEQTIKDKLLPTPRTSDMNGAGLHGDGGVALRTAVKLLPTPTARDYKDQGANVNHRRGEEKSRLPGTLHMRPVKLLPTPASADGGRTSDTYGRGNPTLAGSLSSGATTNPPSGDGKRSTALRLNPSFTGWMMGTPSCAECGREWTDPDCPHTAMAFMSTSGGSSETPSSGSNGRAVA